MSYLNQYIGNYKIVSLIKSGGMADVYLGEDINTQYRVAIKILKADYKNDHDVVRRFYIEGAVLEKFDHPNIVKFLFNTDINGQPVMVMEYLEGYDMNELLNKKEPVAINLITDYFLQVLDAVIYAHAKNVVHRDIKPSNIFITNDGVVKLLDFGIAKILLSNLDQTKTGFGQFTPTYMSPEQAAMKKEITEKSDIYSLGVTLYSLLNGKNPYQDMSAFEIGHQVLHEPLPALTNYPYLNNVIARATAKGINERFNTVEEFRNGFIRAVNKREIIENLDNDGRADVFNNDMNQALKLFGIFLAVIILFGFSMSFFNDKYYPTYFEAGNEPNSITPTQEVGYPYTSRFRYFLDGANYIKDESLDCIWCINEDGAMNYSQAQKKETESNRIPKFKEIVKLYDKNFSAGTGFQKNNQFFPAHMHPIFSAVGEGSWFWVSDRHSNPNKAYAINMYNGLKVAFDKENPAFPTHLILINR